MPPSVKEVAVYWDGQPCNVNHGTAEPGSELWSEQVTARKYFVEPHIIEFAEFWKWRGKRVLEIGCGIGTDTLQLVNAGAIVHAVEFSQLSMSLAGRRLKNEAYLYWRNAEEFLPNGPFDLIYSFGVLHHTPHPEKVLRLAYSRLDICGELRIMLYAKWSWKHLFTRQQPEAQAGCPLVRWYSATAARRLVESCGFRVTSIEKAHIFPWRIADYTQHRYVKAFPWNVIPHRWLEPYLGHHLLIKAVKA